MGLVLPPELAGLLAQAGGRWPQADEDRLHQLAGSWRRLAADLRALGTDGSAVARKVGAEHHGESIDAFTAYWDDFARHVDEGADAAEQAATGVDAMAQATLHTKSALVEALRATHARIEEVRAQPWVWGIIIRLIVMLIRMLRTHIMRILATLWRFIRQAIRWLFDRIAWVFRKIAEFFRRLWRKLHKPKPPKREPLDREKIKDPRQFDPETLRGRTPEEIRRAIPENWEQSASKSGGGVVYRDPANPGRQIRVMPGYSPGSRPDPLTWGPYVVVRQNGARFKLPLAGNPTL